MNLVSIFALVGALAFTVGCQEAGGQGGGGAGGSTNTSTSTSTSTSTETTTTSDTSTLDPANFPPAEPAQFIVTIQNLTAQSVFVNASVLYPFAITPTGGADHVFYVDCPCSVCGAGPSCSAKDLLRGYVEIPAGDNVVVDAELVHYVDQQYAVAACPELGQPGEVATCPLATTILPGSDYQIRVDYTTADGPSFGDIHPSNSTQWGKPLWLESYVFAAIPLPNSVAQPLTITDGGPTEVQIVINP